MRFVKFFKILNQLFSVLCYLTLGSFFLIIAFHWWPLEDAIETLYRVYHNYPFSVIVGLTGCGFILLGLLILRIVVKTSPQNEALICRTDAGLVSVSGRAIEDVARKVLKKSPFVKEHKIKLGIRSQSIMLSIRLVLWANDSLSGAVQELQEEIRTRLQKLVGQDNQLEIDCGIDRIQQPEDVVESTKTVFSK